MYAKTGSSNPSFLSIDYNFDGFENMDWIGVYSKVTGLCNGTEQVPVGYSRCQQVAFMDEADTDYVDGFKPGEEIGLFLYDVSEDKFFELTGTYTDYNGIVVPSMLAISLAVYQVTNVVKGDEIQLNFNPELTQVILEFTDTLIELNAGATDKIKLNYISKNVTNIQFNIVGGTGTLVQESGNLYYKYAPTDENVMVNIYGLDIFTNQFVTDKVSIKLNQSVSANAVFEDDNIVFYLKNGSMWVKAKTGKAVVDLFWTVKGVTKRFWRGMVNSDVRIIPIYSNFKGFPASAIYWHYVNGKMVIREGTKINFIF